MCCSARVEEEIAKTAESLSFASAALAAAPSSSQEAANESNPVSTVLLENSSGSLHLLRVSSGRDGNCNVLL